MIVCKSCWIVCRSCGIVCKSSHHGPEEDRQGARDGLAGRRDACQAWRHAARCGASKRRATLRFWCEGRQRQRHSKDVGSEHCLAAGCTHIDKCCVSTCTGTSTGTGTGTGTGTWARFAVGPCTWPACLQRSHMVRLTTPTKSQHQPKTLRAGLTVATDRELWAVSSSSSVREKVKKLRH